MKTPNLTEVLREYLADGGSHEVYNAAKKELAAIKSQLTPVAADFEACPADHAKLQAMRLAPKFCPACGVRLQSR